MAKKKKKEAEFKNKKKYYFFVEILFSLIQEVISYLMKYTYNINIVFYKL